MIIPLLKAVAQHPDGDYPFNELFSFLRKSNTDVLIAGGFVSRLISKRPMIVGDVDLYVPNDAERKKLIDYFMALETERGIMSIQLGSASNCKSGVDYNGIIAHNFGNVRIGNKQIDFQIIETDFTSPFDIFNTYDFTVCQGAIDVFNYAIIASDNCKWDNLTKTLRYKKDPNPGRIEKYINEGYQLVV